MPGKTLKELLNELDFENITPEQRLEGIKIMNAQMAKAGLVPMTPEEMVALSQDTKSLERFKKAKEVRKKIDEIKLIQNEIGDKFNGIPTPLSRSLVYLYDISGTKEAEEKNKLLEEKMSTIEGQREAFRDLFERMKQQDLGAFYTSDIDEQIDFLSSDTKSKMFMFETDYPRAEFKKYPPDVFTAEEDEIFNQLKGAVQGGGQYQDNISAIANPISLFMPDLSTEELLRLYASSMSELGPEIGMSINNIMNLRVNLDGAKHSKTVYSMLKSKGFFDEGYGVYAIGQGKKISGSMGISYLSDENRGDIEFNKYKLGDSESKIVDTIKITKNDIISYRNAQYLSNAVKNAKFTGTPTEVKFKKAVAIERVKSGNYKKYNLDTLKEITEFSIKVAESGEHIFNGGLQDFSNEEKEVIASQLNITTIGNYMDAIKAIASEKKTHKHVYTPGSLVFKGIFNPKIDGSGFVKLKGTPETIEKIKRIQKEAEGIVIPTDTFSEKEASYIVFSEFIKPEYISKGYTDSVAGPGSSLPEGFDAYDGGLTNFFQNTVGNDERDNMHYSRLYSAQARKDAIELIEKFKNGDKQPLADSMKLAFTNCLGVAKTGLDPTIETNLTKYTSVIDLYDVLQDDKFKGLVSFSEEERQFVEFFRQEKKIVDEFKTLKEEIIHESVMKQANGNSDLKSDRELQGKIIKLNARTYFLDRQQTYINAYNEAMAAKFGALKSGTEANKRPMFEIEKNFLYDPKAYIEGLEDHFRVRENEFISIGKSNSYLELAQKVGAMNTLDISEPGLLSNLTENEVLRRDISERIKQFEDTAKYVVEHGGKPGKDTLKVIKALKNLPCMKEDFPEHPTPSQIDERINGYKQAMETLGDEMYEYLIFEDDLVDKNSFEFQSTLQTAIRRLESAKSEYYLEAELKLKAVKAESERIQEEYRKANGKENEQLINKEEFINDDELDRISREYVKSEFSIDCDDARTANGKFKDKRLTKLLDMLSKLPDIRTANPRAVKIVSGEIQAEFDNYIQDLNKQMLDSDDPMIEEKLHIANRLSSSFDRLMEAKDLIPEAQAADSPYREAYKNTVEMIGRLKEELEADNFGSIETRQKDQMQKTIDNTITSLEHIRDAIENEAYNLDGPKLKDLTAKDLVTVSAYRFVHASQNDDVRKAILKNSDKAIDSLAKNKIVKENMKTFGINELSEHLNPRSNGFANIIKEKTKTIVQENKPVVKQIDTDVRRLN